MQSRHIPGCNLNLGVFATDAAENPPTATCAGVPAESACPRMSPASCQVAWRRLGPLEHKAMIIINKPLMTGIVQCISFITYYKELKGDQR